MHVLDRSFFRKRIQLAAANIFDLKNHSRVRRECVHDVLDAPRMKPFLTVPWGYNQERSVLLFKPGVQAYGMACENPPSEFTADEYLRSSIHPQQKDEVVP